jgi:hypothetical protein
MKTTRTTSAKVRGFFNARRRARTRPDPWLILNLGVFNFASGWNYFLTKAQMQQSSR